MELSRFESQTYGTSGKVTLSAGDIQRCVVVKSHQGELWRHWEQFACPCSLLAFSGLVAATVHFLHSLLLLRCCPPGLLPPGQSPEATSGVLSTATQSFHWVSNTCNRDDIRTTHRYGHVHYILYNTCTTNYYYTILISFKCDKTWQFKNISALYKNPHLNVKITGNYRKVSI